MYEKENSVSKPALTSLKKLILCDILFMMEGLERDINSVLRDINVRQLKII